MTMLQHTGISAVAAGLLWWLAGPIAALTCMIAGVLIDLDHLFDYVMNYGMRRFQIGHFFHAFKLEILKKVFVLLHAWELVALAWLAAWYFKWQPALLGAAIGLGLHLLLDQIFNAHNPAAYILSYRIWHRFNGRAFYGTQELKRRHKALAEHQAKTARLTSKAGQ